MANVPRDARFLPDAPRNVELLAFPDVQLLDVAGPLQVFASANDLVGANGQRPPYRLSIVALAENRVRTSAGLVIDARSQPAAGRMSEPVDTLLVPGGRGVPGASDDPEVIAWIRERARQARRVASVCTGAFLLGAGGLLDHRRVVTHWSFCAELARRFPSARVEPDRIFIRDGALWTSAGVSAGIDLALALVEEDLGHQVALAVARYLVVFLKRPGGQTQFSAALALQTPEAEFDALHGWIASHLDDDLSLPALARKAGMSERSFSRRYALATGVTPSLAVVRLRVEAACRLLSERSLPMKRVAARCGFASEGTMRRSFLRLLQVTPKEYRARFGS